MGNKFAETLAMAGSDLPQPYPTACYQSVNRIINVRFKAYFPEKIRKSVSGNDEAHFWLNGYINKQNCRIWSEANPQVYVETPLHPEKLTVWCALWAGGILLQKRLRPQRYSQW
ncbi:hypothetical protein TNCV_924101 [Trichonephila clavipes]|nr:hypothetical protein TNCV_924101 [Trichonephila clavipes]